MYTSSLEPRAVRRGIVLVLVLGMLGLMALIGVTFAVFAGQSLINGRNFAQGVMRPQAESLMDYALAQLINDTNVPTSAIRGHSLLRDMYGNDSVYRGSNPPFNSAVEFGGLLTNIYTPATGFQPLYFDLHQARPNGNNGGTTAFYNQYEYRTNIPTNGQYYGLDFTRWIVRFPNNGPAFPNFNVAQSFEVLEDDASGSVHVFTLAANLINPTTNDPTVSSPNVTSGDWTTFIYRNANLGALLDLTTTPGTVFKFASSFAKEVNPSTGALSTSNTSAAFVLDGRYMRAFNGAGLTQTASRVVNGSVIDTYPFNFAAYGNFRLLNKLNVANGFATVDPDSIGMDEDYDACDLENWYLGIQSADGQVVVPSFHRPAILQIGDWTSPSFASQAKILRPRQADNSPLFPPDPNSPDPITGKLTFDVDNDGDGVTDSVWLDLGYPIQRDSGGKLFKPLFAFMILGLNGRLPLNTVGNLQDRAIGDQTNTLSTGSGETLPDGTKPGPSSINTNKNGDATTQVPQPGPYPTPNTPSSPDASYFRPPFSSQVYLDSPLWDHASHLGYSVNEINPKFALQNAPSNLYATSNGPPANNGITPANPYGVYPSYNGGYPISSYFQYDNVGVSVALTQMRNLLSGTVPTDVANPLPLTYLNANGDVNFNSFPVASQPKNFDINAVIVDGLPWVLPNNVADGADIGGNSIFRNQPPMAGRWGEPQGIPQILPNVLSSIVPAYTNAPIYYPIYWYNNPVRAGRSFLLQSGTNDAMDDDADALDPYLPNLPYVQNQLNTSGPFVSVDVANVYSLVNAATTTTANQYQIPLPAYTGSTTFDRGNPNAPTPTPGFTPLPEYVDRFDAVGQRSIASERIRAFTTPIDPAGVGLVVDFLNRPNNDHDYGRGTDRWGRTSFYRYFRPAGMPQEIHYPYSNANANFPYPYATNSGLGQQYLMPVLLPAGQSSNPNPASKPNTSTNLLHGYQAALTMYLANATTPTPWRTDTIAPMAGLPYDWDTYANMGGGGPPNGYAFTYDPTTMNMPNPNNPRVNLLAPTMRPVGTLATPVIKSLVNSSWGPILTTPPTKPTYVIGYGNLNGGPVDTVVNGMMGTAYVIPNTTTAYLGSGSLNIDEADEMNLYNAGLDDQPFGPSDLEWLYRKHDVDGATLTSRLSKLAPVSFLNPADGQTRRRLFSTDTWELNRFSYANDNPNGQYAANSRFLPNASPSLENMNQVVSGVTGFNQAFANPVATEFLPNPTFPPTTLQNNIGSFIANYSLRSSPTALPLPLTPNNNGGNLFANAAPTATISNGVVIPFGTPSTFQIQTPSIAHGDRKINLNFPLPIANDPAEPVRQKWCRETYQLLKSILPPASVDTPEELAALSQFVVNIVDFRDTDCTMTRFVNTDLEVTNALTDTSYTTASGTFEPIAKPALPGPPVLDPYFNAAPTGVRFAVTPIPAGHFPYDPSIYNPDGDPFNGNMPTPFLVQHGMEYSPIALNEVLAYQSIYWDTKAGMQKNNERLLIELINTLSADQFPNGSPSASDLSLDGWDLVVTPDAYGWGRPDPITGEVSLVAYPPQIPANPPGMPLPQPQPLNASAPLSYVTQSPLNVPGPPIRVPAIQGNTVNYFVIGTAATTDAEVNPIATNGTIPSSILPSKAAAGQQFMTKSGEGQYFWLYLRRPANPFDTSATTPTRPNREMVVVDAIRFPLIEAGSAANVPTVKGVAPPYTFTPNAGTNTIYSTRRLQPYRGGHLIPPNTKPPTTPATAMPAGLTTIAPPKPASAWGYSEQSEPGTTPHTTQSAIYKMDKSTGNPATAASLAGNIVTDPTQVATSKTFQHSLGIAGGGTDPIDSNWSPLPFHDRDFTSVAELLMVPGCPPGLFTKQFVEEPYPGNYTATGYDDSNLPVNTIVAPVAPNVGRKDFPGLAAMPPAPSFPTYPYLSDNFYYSAASVAPPQASSSLDANYTRLTTEIGGWTGAGWHKMLEFFEVPSSANGATGPAAGGANYDWARADLKPGLINLNLIIDEEVFAGLIDEPRLNEQLAVLSSWIPSIVTQIDVNGYPVFDNVQTSPTYGRIYGAYPIFSQNSQIAGSGGVFLNNPPPNTTPPQPETSSGLPAGRGYSLRDPDLSNYNTTSPPPAPNNFPPQLVHGIKAAFSDFLKLRHGGSGFLFAFGNGPTGSGDCPPPQLLNGLGFQYPVIQSHPYVTVPPAPGFTTLPVAAERPYRSLSYPDINLTIMRPASLPPSSPVVSNGVTVFAGTVPPLPVTNGTTVTAGLEALGLYFGITGFPYVQLQPNVAPMQQSPKYQYVFDPGIKNPFLPIQYLPGNTKPPYATPAPGSLTPAPFPPPIPPTPARRLFQVPDHGIGSPTNISNANVSGGYDSTQPLGSQYAVNQPTIAQQLSTGIGQLLKPVPGVETPPNLVADSRNIFLPDNYVPQTGGVVKNLLGSGGGNDYRQHPLYRTEMLQKVMNLTTVRTHQFAVWITVGFFEVVSPGTAELGITDALGQEVGLTSGKNVRYRSFFVIDRTKATGFNPYYPGNFRDCVTYRRRIE